MKKWLAMMLCLVMVFSFATGCSDDTQEDAEQIEEETVSFEGKTLVVYTALSEGSDAYSAYMEQVAAFEEKTGAIVDVKPYGENLPDVLDNALDSGSTVDVFPVSSLTELNFHMSDALDLTSYVENSDIEEHTYDVYMDLIQARSADGASVYALPTTASVQAVWYNQDVFEQVGVTAPKTMEEFETVCDKLVEAGYRPMALDKPDARRYFAAHMERVMGEEALLNLAANGGWTKDDKAVTACDQLIEWVNADYFDENAPVDWPFSQLGLADKVVMICTDYATLSMVEEIVGKEFNWGCFNYPQAGGSYAAKLDCGGWCINANTVEADLAWAYLRFMTTGEADKAISEAADTVPCDKTNTDSVWSDVVTMLAETDAVWDNSGFLSVSARLDDVIVGIYAGDYADGAEAAAAMDALYA